MTTVQVYHKVSFDELPYPWLTHVFSYDTCLPAIMPICHEAWHLFAAGYDGTDVLTAAYRAAGNRRLSDGDVIAVDGIFAVVTGRGWKPVDVQPFQLVRYGTAGTVPSRLPVMA